VLFNVVRSAWISISPLVSLASTRALDSQCGQPPETALGAQRSPLTLVTFYVSEAVETREVTADIAGEIVPLAVVSAASRSIFSRRMEPEAARTVTGPVTLRMV